MRLHRLLREEEALADLTVDEPVRDELQNLDLATGRLLLELAQRGRERDHRGVLGAATPCSRLVEAAAVVHVTAQDLLALCGVHANYIGVRTGPL